MQGFCHTCDGVQEVEAGDTEGMVFCTVCGDEFPLSSQEGTSTERGIYDYFVTGRVITFEEIPKKNLKVVRIDTTGDGESNVQVVTNAKHIDVGWLVVVALENSVVPAGAIVGEDPDAVLVKTTSVGGVRSEGMLCDRSVRCYYTLKLEILL